MNSVKKLSIVFIMIMLITCIFTNKIYASLDCNVNLSTSRSKLTYEEEFSVYADISDLQTTNGIIAIGAVISYDTDSLTLESIEGQNKWSDPFYNKSSGKFTSFKSELSTSDERVLKMTFTVKDEDEASDSAWIKISDFEISDGEEEKNCGGSSIKLKIEGEESTSNKRPNRRPGVTTMPDTDPTEPSEPTYPSEPSEPTYPSEPSEPTYPSEPSEPTYPSEPTEPTQPAEPTEPPKPIESSENENNNKTQDTTNTQKPNTNTSTKPIIETAKPGIETKKPTEVIEPVEQEKTDSKNPEDEDVSGEQVSGDNISGEINKVEDESGEDITNNESGDNNTQNDSKNNEVETTEDNETNKWLLYTISAVAIIAIIIILSVVVKNKKTK